MKELLIAERNSLDSQAGAAYVAYIQKMRTAECLGQAYKFKHGKFGEAELEAHKDAARLLGRHQAFAEAANALTNLLKKM